MWVGPTELHVGFVWIVLSPPDVCVMLSGASDRFEACSVMGSSRCTPGPIATLLAPRGCIFRAVLGQQPQ